MYFHKLVSDIGQYIEDELKDSIYYVELAKKAPTSFAKEILTEFSKEEKTHSENFKQAYYYLTGKMYTLKPVSLTEIPDYKKALKIRILAETQDYKKYGEHYLESSSKYFKDLFFKIRTMEAEHAMRISILFEEED